MKNILVTGIGGFVGQHLEKELLSQHFSVQGVVYRNNEDQNYHTCDLTDPSSVDELDFTGIESVIHLAGLSAVGPSFGSPQSYINDNTSMLINICEKLLAEKLNPRLLVVSSGAVYAPGQSTPISENSAIGFYSPYAVSKVAVENMAAYYVNRGLDIVVVRPFNHIGPGQSLGFILPDLTLKAMEALKNNTPLVVGKNNTSRDYTDVRDVVKAYVQLATVKHKLESIYNVCSGKSLSRDQMLQQVLKQVDPNNKITIEYDESMDRPIDNPLVVGSNTLLNESIGWEPKISISQTIKDYLSSI